jgi:hypothetical protein
MVLVKELFKERDDFLNKVENKFFRLLKQEPDPAAEIADAARRLEAAGLLWDAPSPSTNLRTAAMKLIGENPLMAEVWKAVQEAGYWKAAETPAELISALLPSPESLD